jgi:hypothetical protein
MNHASLSNSFTLRPAGRVFALSNNGLIGLVPQKTQIGDSICIFERSELPLVLRPRETKNEFIGQCYVHGIMGGEVWSHIEIENRGHTFRQFRRAEEAVTTESCHSVLF